MDDIKQPSDFQIKEIKQEQIPIQQMPSKKKGHNLFFLFNKKNSFRIIIAIIIIVVLAAAAAVIWGRHSFSRAKVNIDIEVPKNIASGEEAILIIKYKNNNRVALKDAYLIIDYPPDTFSLEGKEIYQERKELGIIPRKSQGKEEIKLRFVGDKGSIKNLMAKLDYQPQNINSRFENSSLFRIEINSVLVELDIEGSEKTISGQGVNYSIEYENKTRNDIYDLRLKLKYSADFEFKQADPSPEAVEEEGETNSLWEIDRLAAGEKRIINLNGIIKGEEGEDKVLRAVIGKVEGNNFFQYTQAEFITKISPSPLLLSLSLKEAEEKCNVNQGQVLNYKIEFKNNTDVALEEIILKAYFKNDIFDFRSLKLNRVGFFDSRKNMITWSGAEIPALDLLEPNQSGQVDFSIKIKDSLPIYDYNDKNFEAEISVEIETLTIPAKFTMKELRVVKDLTCKINSQLILETSVYYYESETAISNTGPIPPQVDKLTTYTVHWDIVNTSNDLENVKVSAILPQGISWQDNYINNVQGSHFSYNERTKEAIWQINEMPAGVGIVLPVYELIFQIGLRPSINQVDKAPVLINESSIEGRDKFTEINLKDFTPIVDTTLPDDSRVSNEMGKVIE